MWFKRGEIYIAVEKAACSIAVILKRIAGVGVGQRSDRIHVTRILICHFPAHAHEPDGPNLKRLVYIWSRVVCSAGNSWLFVLFTPPADECKQILSERECMFIQTWNKVRASGKDLNCKLCVGQPAKTKRSRREEGAPQSCWINSSPFAPLETVTGGTPLNLICKRINLVLYSPAKFQRGEFYVSFDWILFCFI